MIDKVYDYVVVGAGLSGLYLAHYLTNHGNKEVLVLEKSRGVGGRMATRRDGTFTFDHGTQFVKNDEFMKELILRWNEKGLLQNIGDDLFCAKGGMTKLAKDLAAGLSVEFQKKVHKVSFHNNKWTIEDDESHSWTARELILTAPVPQIIELLERSGLSYPPDLKNITYTKALVFLIKGEYPKSASPYREVSSSSVFSISSQKLKGTSSSNSEVVVMNPDWSEKHFEEAEEVILAEGRNILQQELPGFTVADLQLKKWRYAFPQNTYYQNFLSLENGLYLAGDGFCEGNLNGALKSAHSLINKEE